MKRASPHTARRLRRGFSLIELVVSLVIFGIIGAALTKLLTSQGNFYDKMGMGNAARNVSRGSLNRVVSDFRMIETTGGMIAASATSVTIRVPFAIGVVCAASGGATQISMLPVDSVMYNAPGFYGYAWRSPITGAYVYQDLATKLAGTLATCTGQNILTIPPTGQVNGLVIGLQPVLPVGATLGTPVFLYRRVQYSFQASTAVPGKLGLYRTIVNQNGTQTAEEIVAPFAATAGFKFFIIGNSTTAQVNPPALLSDLRGIELHLDGTSENRVAGSASSESAPFTTAVFFKNRIN
jgi:prepilin-type N-terminal cleavage/methylation domain-containing protein